MNKWVALIIGIVIVILGCVVGASTGPESRTAGLVVFLSAHLLALLVFIIFLRKHPPVLLAGIMFQVIVIAGLLLAGEGPASKDTKAAPQPAGKRSQGTAVAPSGETDRTEEQTQR